VRKTTLAQLPARCDVAHRPGVLLQWNVEAQQQFAGAGFSGVAVEFGKAHFQIGHLHAICFRHLFQRVYALAFGFDLPQFFMAHDHGVERSELFKGELVLPQLAETDVRLQHHLASGGLEFATEDFHQGGLAATIGTDQAVVVAVVEFDGNVLKQGFCPELDRKVGSGDHG